MSKKPYRYSILEAVANEMRKNKEMCYFYEYESPIATLPTGEVLNLWKEFGDLRTSAQGWPLDEAWYVGAATGLGAAGVRVVLELPSMTTVFAFEQIFNQIGNIRMMTGGQASMPVVIWQDGAARAGGSAQQHSQVGWEAMYASIPGLKIVAPSNAYDAAGLMTAAIHDPDPVLFCDYSEVASGEQPDVPDQSYEVPIGQAAVRQEGKDITLVAWSPATVDAQKALPDLAKAGLSVEYIDLRTIKPLDEATLVASVKKTGKLLVVDHGYWTNGFSANVVAVAAQKVPGAKVARITFPDAAGPAAKEMIGWMRPDAPKIVAAVTALVKG
ncbi:MAG TPA: transketolase C-terminal domain-containing protein [Anaerolineae bacterium]